MMHLSAAVTFQSRYRAASHFRRNYQSASRAECSVSISLSSGFSFQVVLACPGTRNVVQFQSRYRAASHFRDSVTFTGMEDLPGFNLVIERLLISGVVLTANTLLSLRSFNLVIERLLISGTADCDGHHAG